MSRCVTFLHDLVNVVVLSQRLDWMTLEVFSNLNESMILWFSLWKQMYIVLAGPEPAVNERECGYGLYIAN